ncbi:uncharacterized protein LOC135470323 [Liolophura sinensis]|uniref:uncharacterized protein LOC135470323 n=1 Tax=Liolophura sinensis TaxID=3198878 RepID=UPI00315844DE
MEPRMHYMERIEFYLPPTIAVHGEDVVDGPSPVGSAQNDVDHGPTTQQSAQGSTVTQPTDNEDRRSFSFGAANTSVDVTDSFRENVSKLSAEQRLILDFLVEDLSKGRCKLNFCEETRKVVVHDIKQESQFAAKIPERTLKIANKLKADNKQLETKEFCDFIDRIKHMKPPGGVVLKDDMVTLGPLQRYREGIEFFIIPDVTLGKGLNATIRVLEDKGSMCRHALKSVMVNNFQSNEIRAMVALKDYQICPELYACRLYENEVSLYMEKLDNCVTLEEVIRQLPSIEHNPHHRFNFALYILLKLSKIVNTIHVCGWFHCDLHSGNVVMQRANSNDVKLKVIDFGNAKGSRETSKSEDKVNASKSDVCNMLRQFCSLVLLGDWFEDLFDFEKNFDRVIKEVANTVLPSDLTQYLLSIIQNGFNLKAVFDHEAFISKLPGHSHNIHAEDISIVVEKLEFTTESDFTDLHSSQRKDLLPCMEKLYV